MLNLIGEEIHHSYIVYFGIPTPSLQLLVTCICFYILLEQKCKSFVRLSSREQSLKSLDSHCGSLLLVEAHSLQRLRADGRDVHLIRNRNLDVCVSLALASRRAALSYTFTFDLMAQVSHRVRGQVNIFYKWQIKKCFTSSVVLQGISCGADPVLTLFTLFQSEDVLNWSGL